MRLNPPESTLAFDSDNKANDWVSPFVEKAQSGTACAGAESKSPCGESALCACASDHIAKVKSRIMPVRFTGASRNNDDIVWLYQDVLFWMDPLDNFLVVELEPFRFVFIYRAEDVDALGLGKVFEAASQRDGIHDRSRRREDVGSRLLHVAKNVKFLAAHLLDNDGDCRFGNIRPQARGQQIL